MIENTILRRTLLIVGVVVVAGIITAIERSGNKSSVPPDAPNLPPSEQGLPGAPDFSGATGWINTPNATGLDLVGLRGKVVLVDVWTYSCINCIHTLPHVTALYDTYRDHGLVVVGVHSPEFGFEKVRANVADAVVRYGIHYPVAQDNDFGIWNAYHNHYWPADYLVDQYGKIRDTHAGEGGYADQEKKVRDLLNEAGYTDLPAPLEGGVETGLGPHTSELYAAAGRSAVANPEGYRQDQDVGYAVPAEIGRDAIYLGGRWHDGPDAVTALANGTVFVDFAGSGANMVADGPAGACVEVLLDGQPVPAAMTPSDVTTRAGKSCILLDRARSYDLYRGPNERHALELRVPEGFQLFTFDFTG